MSTVTVDSIIENLERTIAVKDAYLNQIAGCLGTASFAEGIAIGATMSFLETNLVELRNILDHVKELKKS